MQGKMHDEKQKLMLDLAKSYSEIHESFAQ